MENIGGMAAIMGVCVIVLLIGAMGRKVEWLVNFILRAVMGVVGIYFANYFCSIQNISAAVGINPLTVLTSGFLGFPGIIVLYGINFFKML
ncbi:MAG: pro-sigmaK processing inhibitor BofA family protein [Clostridiales bacterium]|nr:pro-sigmaK processing inhibitor BofA family protein [Clostridiales bacterium]